MDGALYRALAPKGGDVVLTNLTGLVGGRAEIEARAASLFSLRRFLAAL